MLAEKISEFDSTTASPTTSNTMTRTVSKSVIPGWAASLVEVIGQQNIADSGIIGDQA